MTSNRCHFLLALSVTLLLALWLGLTLPSSYAQAPAGIEGERPAPLTPHWKQLIQRIEQDKQAGLLSLDEAALLRFTALSDWENLPAPYRQDSLREEPRLVLEEGMLESAEKFDALFIDQTAWSEATRQTIATQMEQAEVDFYGQFNEQMTTTHFLLHWDSTGGPNTPANCSPSSCAYVTSLALTLESSWSSLEQWGYDMPAPSVFGRPRIHVYVVAELELCRISVDRVGLSWPGEIRLSSTLTDPTVYLPLFTHELYHQVQWHYVGFHGNGCGVWLDAWTWYWVAGNFWLMEDTATWAEHEVHGNLARQPAAEYRKGVRRYFIEDTNRSLFAVEYDGALFFRYLQEQVAPHAGYSNTRDINMEVWQVLSDTVGEPEDKSTVEALTTVIGGFPAPYEKWQPLFADFARTNYFKDYDFAAQLFNGVQVPRQVHRPVANPSIPLADDLLLASPPAAVYHEIHPAALNIAGGSHATGATLHLALDPACGSCGLDGLTLDTLFYRHGTLLTHTATVLDYTVAQTLTTEFASASGVTSMTLIVANAPPRDLSTEAHLWLTATDNAPIAPAALTATTPPAGGITLAWSPVHETGIRYVIERQDWQNSTTLATVSTPTLGYSDQSAQVGTVYRYRVRALDTGGNPGPPTAVVQALICPTPPPLLLVYLLDASSSMQERFVGTTTKLAAAKQAIHAGNDLLRTWNNRSRAGLVVVQASPNLGPPHYRSLIFPTTYHTAPTTNLTALETEVARVAWYGNSPLAHALRWAKNTLTAAHPADPTQRPVLLWLTDGQPTVSYEEALTDGWGYPFLDEDVQAVPLQDANGNYYPPRTLRRLGAYYPRYELYAGEPLADVMEASHALRDARPAPTLHALEVQNSLVSTFEEGLLPYVADIGGGLAAAPATLDTLSLATLQALAHSACLPSASPLPTATPTAPPGPRPTPTP